MKKSKLNKRAVRVFSICLILMFVLPIISVFFVGAYNYHVYYDVGVSANIVIDGYYNLSVGETNNDTTWFTGVYVDVWDESINDYRIVELSYITVSDYYTHPPIGSSQHVFYWNGYVYYNGLYVPFKSGESTVYRSLQNNVTTHSPHYFYIKEGATKNTSGYEISFKRSSNQSQTWFDLTFGYTLTFNSQGGSAINPIEGIEEGETILLGDSTGYYTEYVPTKPYYIFDGWSLQEEGSVVRQVTVTEDTVLYAQYHVNPQNCQILTSSTNNYASFYTDSNFTHSVPPIIVAGSNVTLDVWIDDNAPENWYFDYLEVEYNNSSYRLYQETLDPHFTIPIDQAGYVQLNAVYSLRHTVEIQYNPRGENNDNTFDFYGTDNAFLTGETVHLWGGYSFPSFWTNTRIIGKNTNRIYESHVNVYDEWNESEEGFDFDMYFTMPDEDVIVMVFWSVMSGVPAQPSVSYDESGNPYFVGIDEEDIFSQDFSRANDLIPEQLVGVAEYFTYFDGLTVIVTIILVAGFAAYILRHSV